MGTHAGSGLAPAPDSNSVMMPSGPTVLGIIAVLVAIIIMLVMTLTPKPVPRTTIEEMHILKDGRNVVCLVIPHRDSYEMSCDWMTAQVKP